MENYPKIGIGAMIFKEGKILLGKRKGSHAAGTYSVPGGTLEYGETMEESIRREIQEETGLEITNIRFNYLSDEFDHMPKHFVNIGFVADWKSGEVTTMEPEKCEGWDWYDMDTLPEPLFIKTKQMVDAYKTGVNYLGQK